MATNRRTCGVRTGGLPAAVLFCVLAAGATARAARIKDITTIEGVRANHLYGFGLVIGLAQTGDGGDFTSEVARNMLKNLRVGRGLSDVDSGNLSAVVVTAELPPFARKGTRINVTVSAFDKSQSLRGGTLLLTPLMGPDGKVYAVAQGAISTGGFNFSGAAASVSQGHPTVGMVPNGAIVEKEVPVHFLREGRLTFCLRAPDFITAARIAQAVNRAAAEHARARVVDAGTVEVLLDAAAPPADLMRRIGEIQMLEVEPDARAVVVINERTGTVVAGHNVGISAVAIAHGNLTVITREEKQVSQPSALSGGQTTTVDRTSIDIHDTALRGGKLNPVQGGATVSDVARALNNLGASPRDIISIFQALKEAGALHAELRIM